MKDAYHPDTLEYIPTDTPADWMLRAGVAAPAYNPANDGLFWQNGAWVIVSALPQIMAGAKVSAGGKINAACAASIVGGFASSALGTPHTYDSALEDQINLIGAVSLGIDLPYRCADAAGIKVFHLHTAAQLRQVAADGALVKLTALEKAATLKAQVQAAADAAAVEAVAW